MDGLVDVTLVRSALQRARQNLRNLNDTVDRASMMDLLRADQEIVNALNVLPLEVHPEVHSRGVADATGTP